MQQFLEQHSIYVVFSIVMIIWIGIATFLMVVDRRIKKLENKVKNIMAERSNL